MNNLQDKCRGSLVGGAVGDALGYAVEFDSLREIRRKYGEEGIRNYELENGVAVFSDDTQMSLFTAEGVLCASQEGKILPKEMLPYISTAYINWYFTQTYPPLAMKNSWLMPIKNLWERRAPGMTCMAALKDLSSTPPRPVVNDSKGCGGVMRVAPIGLYSAAHPKVLDLMQAGYLAGYAAELTHKHSFSTFSSMALAMIAADCIQYDRVDREKFRFIVIDRVFKLIGLQYQRNDALADIFNLILKALWLATSNEPSEGVIRQLGEGWVAEETLAIAIFSVMRYIDDFEKCIVCAVNHDGDSDSTGAVAGNIIGAILGYEAIPEKYLNNLELQDVIVSVADDLCGYSSEEQMTERYKNHKPYNINKNLLLE